MNILLAGADNGDDKGDSIAETVAKGSWHPGVHRSDTIMVLHLTADRKHAYLISVPRDTYTNVDGYGMQKINAAFSFGGPSLYVQTLEQFSGLRMKHLAIIDWNGFRDVSNALGGVRVYVSENSYNSSHDVRWTKGWQTIKGERALEYVRTRHGLAGGDFDRIQRQQNFMRAMLSQLASRGTLTNPVKFKNSLHAMTDEPDRRRRVRQRRHPLAGLVAAPPAAEGHHVPDHADEALRQQRGRQRDHPRPREDP